MFTDKGEVEDGEEGDVRLWTLQGRGFIIESTSVDHNKSEYYNDVENLPNVQRAYHRLFEELKTDRFLWCFPLERFHHESNKTLYELEVPEGEILAYICECVWHKIITNCAEFGNRNCVDSLWKRKKDTKDYRSYTEEQNKKCFSKESEDQLWNRLFWPQPITIPCMAGITMQPQHKKEMCSALIKSPIEKEWIINKG